jgi:hypothetical protein
LPARQEPRVDPEPHGVAPTGGGSDRVRAQPPALFEAGQRALHDPGLRQALLALLIVVSGCARSDWIDRTLVTVDVTGTWQGDASLGSGGSGHSLMFEFTLEQHGRRSMVPSDKKAGEHRARPASMRDRLMALWPAMC